MNDIRFAKSFKKLVEVNGNVQSGETVVIVTDFSMTNIARQLAVAANAVGAVVCICIMDQRTLDGQEPPKPIAMAMLEADVIFSPVRYSITHTRAMKEALNNGARAILMTAHNEEVLLSPALLETDFEAQIPKCKALGKAFAKGNTVRLTSPKGTDLTFSIKGRGVNVLTNIPNPGELAPVPDIEVNVVPVTGSANGRLIFDASVPYLGIGILKEDIICEVKDGFIISMEGGEQANFLKEKLDSYNDPNCYNVAELGVGMNPGAQLTGNMLDDEGIVGTIHIGIGTSLTLGGEIVAPMHYDLIMWEPTIEVDGVIIQQNKELICYKPNLVTNINKHK